MPDTAAFDRHDLDDMVHEAERWRERTMFVSIEERLKHANPEQLKQLMNMGLGNADG